MALEIPKRHLPATAKLRALPTEAIEQQRAEFEKLADQWRRETIHESQIKKKVAHSAYLRTIGMGKPALPLLVEALRDRPDHWFPALQAIANTDPARDATTPSAARDAWLSWASAEGLLP